MHIPRVGRAVHQVERGVASVRNTILAAFRESCFDGFQMLAAACLLVDNVTLCKNLIVVLTELGHYGEFRVLALTQLMTVVAYASSAEVREAAAQAIATLQSKSRGFDFLAGPRPFARQTRWPATKDRIVGHRRGAGSKSAGICGLRVVTSITLACPTRAAVRTIQPVSPTSDRQSAVQPANAWSRFIGPSK